MYRVRTGRLFDSDGCRRRSSALNPLAVDADADLHAACCIWQVTESQPNQSRVLRLIKRCAERQMQNNTVEACGGAQLQWLGRDEYNPFTVPDSN